MYHSKYEPFILPDNTHLYPRHWNREDVLDRATMSQWKWQPIISDRFAMFVELNSKLWSDSFIAPSKGADIYLLYETPDILAFLGYTGRAQRGRHCYSILHLDKSKANTPCKIRREVLRWDGNFLAIPYGKWRLVWNGSVQAPVVELIS